MKVGDLALSKLDSVPESHWQLTRITNTFPDRNNIVRTV